MNRTELVRQVAQRAGMSPADADAAVKAALDAVAGALARGETVRIAGVDKPANWTLIGVVTR